MNQIRISIIIPVYNTGVYLEEALKTVFSQKFRSFELICVDDFSDDYLTKNILQNYCDKYENMKVIWLERNAGAGNARNIGFSKATGEYTIFLDADDLFAEDFLEKMYNCIVVNQADVCVCGYKEFYIKNKKKYFKNQYIPNDYKVNTKNREDWLLDIPMSAWNKLCKTQFLKENTIFFQSLASCNDVFFSCMVMINAKKRCFVDEKPLIFYRTNLKTQISFRRNPMNLYTAVILVENFAKKENNSLVIQWLASLLLGHGIIEIQNCCNELYNQQFYYKLKEFFRKHKVCFQNNMLLIYMQNIKKLSYKNWKKIGFDDMDFLNQLHFSAKLLKKRINGEKQIFLWGLGYRGNIFQKFCKEQKIILCGVTDIKNHDIGSITDYGNRIVKTEYVLQSDGLVIATNREIYRYLQKENLRVLDLSEFYLF